MHGSRWAKLGRNTARRVAMIRDLVTSLIEHERIETTVPRARAISRMADRMVTLGKKGTNTSIIKLKGFVRTKDACHKLLDDLVERFRHRDGGYTRVLRTRTRRGDAASLAVLEWTETNKTILTKAQLAFRADRKAKVLSRQAETLPSSTETAEV